MLFTISQINEMYSALCNWITCKTPGERSTLSRFKYYYKKLWEPILSTIETPCSLHESNKAEYHFLHSTLYNGSIYRIQNYFPKRKGHIYFNDYPQSWSDSLIGVSNVSNLSGSVLLIEGYTTNGILACRLFDYLMHFYGSDIKEIYYTSLPERFKSEHEIVASMKANSVKRIYIVDKDNILNDEIPFEELPRRKWARNKLN